MSKTISFVLDDDFYAALEAQSQADPKMAGFDDVRRIATTFLAFVATGIIAGDLPKMQVSLQDGQPGAERRRRISRSTPR